MSRRTQTPINWPLFGYFLFLTCMVLIGVLLPSDDRICSATLLGQSAKEANTLVFGCAEFWLNRYQTLLAAILAMAAAGLSIHFLRRQIAQADLHEQERYDRAHAAARAVLQITLSEICTYARQSAQRLQAGLTPGAQLGPPVSMPDQPIERLRAFIASIDATRSAIVSKLIGDIQVHQARSTADHANFNRMMPRDIAHYIIDAAEIYARASMLFDYARRETDEFPTDPERRHIRNALFSIDVALRHHPEISDILDSRFAQETA